jgi:hypothetical protein
MSENRAEDVKQSDVEQKRQFEEAVWCCKYTLEHADVCDCVRCPCCGKLRRSNGYKFEPYTCRDLGSVTY